MSCSVKSVAVVTADQELYGECVNVLSRWQVPSVTRGGWEGWPDTADLWVWDARAVVQTLHHRTEDLSKCMFLVDRNNLMRFPEEVLLFAAAVALLPIDAARLTIAFEQAFANRALCNGNHTAACRSEKDALLQCVLQANLKLQEYDQDRTNFLNRALHDLRAPLTSILGYCGLLLGGEAGALEANQMELLQRIETSARRLARLSDGMFQLGVWRFKEMKPELVKGDIHGVVDTALAEVEAFLQQKQITVAAQLDEPEGTLLFDPERLLQVFINILENASRFSPKRGTIQIRGGNWFFERRSRVARLHMPPDRRSRQDRNPNAYRVDIADSGPGILPEHLPYIFEEYTSYSGGRDRSGSGLGLAISKGIIDMHEGKLWAEAAPSGATFSFALPFAAVRAKRACAIESQSYAS